MMKPYGKRRKRNSPVHKHIHPNSGPICINVLQLFQIQLLQQQQQKQKQKKKNKKKGEKIERGFNDS